MKIYLAGFAAVLLAGVTILAIHHFLHEPSGAVAATNSPSSPGSSALDSIPAPTGAGSSSDLQTPNVPMNDAQKTEDEDAKIQAEQNWKADHAEAANSTNSNVTDEDRKELDDSEKANSQPVNQPK